MLNQAPRGTNDILPPNSAVWRAIEHKIADVCARFGFREIRTPVFENTELFERGVGDTTDVVQKEMYTFVDKGNRSITLRPEGTAGVARAFLERNLYALPLPAKLYYNIACYRYEKPQAGRLREFHQFGVECFGSSEPSLDAEVIALAHTVLTEAGIPDLRLYLNSIGCPQCRSAYNEALKAYFKPYLDDGTLCETCRGRFEKNPLRILDCKSPICKGVAAGAPTLMNYLCEECHDHFEAVEAHLCAMGIEFEIDETIVRGLDYYTKTVFEFKTALEGTQGTVCGGGRYDGLVEELGGSPTPGIGFAAGMERILLALEAAGTLPQVVETPDVYLANIGRESDLKIDALTVALRRAGVAAERDQMGRSLKAQMKYADKLGAKWVLVIGESELAEGKATLKQMTTKEEVTVALDAVSIAAVVKGEN